MKRLPLNFVHESAGAKLGEFAGYRMPLYYTKPLEEHHAVRNGCGLFDISHMGQFEVTGRKAEAMLQFTVPNDMALLSNGQALYTPMCREDGGVIDDLIIYRINTERYRIIVNAGTRRSDLAWLREQARLFRVKIVDVSAAHCLFAVQGPKAFGVLAPHCAKPPGSLKYYHFAETEVFGVPAFLARTGYTGEPGCEISVPVEQAEHIWSELVRLGVTPIGLAARDTLRLEAAMSLYGHELCEAWHPLESGLAWTVKLDKGADFIGAMAIRAVLAASPKYRLVGLEITGRGIAREGYPVLQAGRQVGAVTSGALSPTLGKAVALARIRRTAAALGTPLAVEIRGKPVAAEVVRRPFYSNPALRA